MAASTESGACGKRRKGWKACSGSVNPGHIKILWARHVEMEAERARLGITGPVAGGGPAENPLGPDVDLLPVGERFKWLWILFDFSQKHFPEHLPAILKTPPSEKAFSAIASIPMEYSRAQQRGLSVRC